MRYVCDFYLPSATGGLYRETVLNIGELEILLTGLHYGWILVRCYPLSANEPDPDEGWITDADSARSANA